MSCNAAHLSVDSLLWCCEAAAEGKDAAERFPDTDSKTGEERLSGESSGFDIDCARSGHFKDA